MINTCSKHFSLFFIFSLCFGTTWSQLAVHGTTLTASLNTNVTVNGDITIDKNGTLDIQGSLFISGHFNGKGFYNYINKLILFSNDPSSVCLLNGEIDSLILSKNTPSKIFLYGDSIQITHLDFSKENNYLVTGDTELKIYSTINGYSENKHIQTNGIGLVGRKLSTIPVDFPIGNERTGFKPLSISTTSTTGTEYARVGYLFPVEEDESAIEAEPLWMIENNCPVHLYFKWGTPNELNETLFNLKDLRLKGWNGTNWVLVGIDSITGNVKNGYLKSRLILPFEFTYYQFESVLKINKPDISQRGNIELLPSFPNPFLDGTSLHYNLNKESVVAIRIYSPEGHLISDIQQKKPEGYHVEKLSASLFPSAGIYLLVITSEKDVLQTRLINLNR